MAEFDSGIEQIILNLQFYNKEQLERLEVALQAEIQYQEMA